MKRVYKQVKKMDNKCAREQKDKIKLHMIKVILAQICANVINIVIIGVCLAILFVFVVWLLTYIGIVCFRDDIAIGDIIIAVATITLMVVTIQRSHKDAVDTKVINLREDKIVFFTFETREMEILKQMGPYNPVNNHSILFKIVYDGRFSPYYSMEPLRLIVTRKIEGRTEIKGESSQEELRIYNYQPLFENNTQHGFLIHTEWSDMLATFKGKHRLKAYECYEIIIDYEYRNLYPTDYLCKKFRGTIFVRERIRISPMQNSHVKEYVDEAGYEDKEMLWGTKCKIDYLSREKLLLNLKDAQ